MHYPLDSHGSRARLKRVNFEWDAEKSVANLSKHGIDFQTATTLWEDSDLIVFSSVYPDEERFLAVGRIGDPIWTAIFTERGEAIRLISVRRSPHDEKRIYEENQSK